MFEAIRNNKRIAQVILAIIIVPFAFFGMDAYFSGGPGDTEVASVGRHDISVAEFQNALHRQQDNLRQETDGQIDSAVFATAEFRRAVLEDLINNSVIAQFAAKERFGVTAPQLQEFIAEMPYFQEDGAFSRSRYETVLQSSGQSLAGFEASVARDLREQQIVQGIAGSAFAGSAAARNLVSVQLEERVVSARMFDLSDYVDQVEIPAAEVEAYYESNRAHYVQPERLRADYLVFDEEAMLENVAIDEETIRAYYDANQSNYGLPEERRARHILVKVDSDAAEEEVAAARDKAEGLLAQLQADPEQFPALAEEFSEDPGSARAGGDLGFFAPGAMVEAFDAAVFGGTTGEISDVVRTDFGFHLIEVTEVKESTVQPFEQVRDEIAAELKRQEASRRFPLLAEQFANMVYEMPDSLQPTAEELGLTVQQSDWVTLEEGEMAGFTDERLIEGLFDPILRENGENVEAIEVERGKMVAARVVEFEEARELSFDEVRDEILVGLTTAEAAKQAAAQGEETLTALREGGSVEGEWSEARTLMRANPELPEAAMRAVFSAPDDALPAYVGTSMPDGRYAVYRIEAVEHPEFEADSAEVLAFSQQYDRLVAEQEMAAFISALRESYGVEINFALLDPENQ